MSFAMMRLDEIRVEDRFRQDLGDLTDLAQSIKDKGVLQPIIISKDKRLLAGSRRYAAAQKAELEEIPVIVRNTEGELDEREIELIENVHRRDMNWVERAKLEERIFQLMQEKDPNWSQNKHARYVDESVGSVNRRLQLASYLPVIPELERIPTEDAAFKAVKKIEEAYVVEALSANAIVEAHGKPDPDVGYAKMAEGHYKIMDVFKGMEKVPDGSAHFAEVDPPYAIDIDKRKSRSTGNADRIPTYNEIPAQDYTRWIGRLAEEVYRTLCQNAFGVWWFGVEWYQDTLAVLTDAGFKVNVVPAIWAKPGGGQTANPDVALGSSYETFFVFRKGEPKLVKPGRSNVFSFQPVPPPRKIHLTEKPVELMQEILSTFCFPGSRVLVPLLGSGATLRACYRLNHVGIGFDLSKEHKKAFLQRVKEDALLGIKPALIRAVGEEGK